MPPIPRLVPFATLVALLAAACGAGPSATPASPSAPTASGWASPVGSTPVIPILASSELAQGKERLLFTLTDQGSHVLAAPSASVHVRFFDLATDAEHPASAADAVFYWIIDVLGRRRWSFPFVVIGMNAVAIYMAGSIVPLRRIVGIFTGPMAASLGAFGVLFQAIAVLIVEWLILYWMYRRKIFLTA